MGTLRMLGSRWVRGLGLAGIAAAGYAAGLTADRATAQPAGTQPVTQDRRIVAYIYNTVPIYREELGDFLIARGGYDKLDLLVNKRIIEVEASRRKVGVTAIEVQAALENDIKGLGITLEQFASEILKKRYNKSLYEWNEDVIKPKLLLGKMCHDRVKVTEEDLQKSFENKFGEKRAPQIICWSEKDLRAAEKQWDEARKSDEDFDRVARSQADPRLAASAGKIAPLGKYPDVEDEMCVKMLFQLKVGEMSQLFRTPAGYMCIKLNEILPGDSTIYKLTDQTAAALKADHLPEGLLSRLSPLKGKEFAKTDLQAELTRILNPELVKLLNAETGKKYTLADLLQFQVAILSRMGDAAATFASVRPALEREVYEKKMTAEIPKFFAELKQQANPNLLLKGPPAFGDIQESVKQELQEIRQAGGTQVPKR